MTKNKRAPEKTRYSEETSSPGHNSDNEPGSNLKKSKGSPPASSDRHQETDKKDFSDSEDDESLLTLTKKRKNKKPDSEVTAVLDFKSKSPRKPKTEGKASKLRQPSPSQVKATQKRGRKGKKGKEERLASAHSTPEKTTPKIRGRPKKEDSEGKAPSCDSSDDESSVQLVKKRQPEMKQAVVLLKRMSKRDIIDVITQGHRCPREQSTAADAGVKSEAESSDEEPLSLKVKKLKQHRKPVKGKAKADVKSEAESSDDELLKHKVKRMKQHSKPVRGRATAEACSDDEPLVRRVKAAPVKNKCGKRTNGEKDTPKKESKLGEELKSDSDDKCLVKRKSDRAAQSLHRETSSS